MSKGAEIIELLKKVNTDSIWGTGIRLVVQSPNSAKIIDLVIDLRSQARDNPALMMDILGYEAFEAITAI